MSEAVISSGEKVNNMTKCLTELKRNNKGLRNLGNTCYLNSALQAILHTWDLIYYILSEEYREDININTYEKYVVEALSNLIREYWKEDYQTAIEPRTLHSMIHIVAQRKDMELFGIGNQNDIHEFILFLLNTLHEGISYPVKITIRGQIRTPLDKCALESYEAWARFHRKSYSKIIDYFFAQTKSSISCNVCGTVSETFNPECCYTLPIPLNHANQSISIYDCWNAFTRPESMTAKNKYKCEKCNCEQEATKTLNIFNAPQILIVVLKRFRTNGKGQSIKIENEVKYDTVIDIRKYCSGYNKHNAIYDLYSVCCHQGSVRGGHYFAYCKEPNGKWYKFNDSSVTEANENDIKTNAGYCLFYRRHTP